MMGRATFKTKVSALLVAALTVSSIPAGAFAGTAGWGLPQNGIAEAASISHAVYGSPKAVGDSVTGSAYGPIRGLTAAPSAPTGGSWVSPSFDRINLSWEGGIGSVHYKVYRDGVLVGQTDELTFTDQPLPERSSVDYTVTAVTYGGVESAPLHIYAGTPTQGETLLSASATHVPGNNSVVSMAMSDDGQVAAFVSRATNLLPGIGDADNGVLYIRSIAADRLSTAYNLQTEAPLTDIRSLSLNRDGSLIAFSAKGADQVEQVYVAEPNSGKLFRITHGSRGGRTPSLTAAGDKVVFITDEALIGEDTNGQKDIYIADVLGGGSPTLLPIPEIALGRVAAPHISADGGSIIFGIEAPPQLTFSVFGAQGLFQYDLTQGVLRRIDQFYSGYSQSADGRYVAYGKQGSIYLFDRQKSASSLVVQGSSEGMIYESPVLDADGGRLVYEYTDYSAMDIGMLNHSGMIWHDLAANTVKRLGHPASYTADESISEDGTRVGYRGDYMGELNAYGFNHTGAFVDCPIGCAAAPPQGNKLDKADWQAAGLMHGQIRIGGTLLIEASGTSHADSVIAHVEYTAYAADSTTLEKRQVDVILSELPAKAGAYQGSFTVPPGAKEISSIQVELMNGQGPPAIRNAARLPLQVTGAADITLQCEDMTYIQAAKLVVWSPTLHTGATISYMGVPEVTMYLPAGDDYHLSLLGTDGSLLAQLPNIQISSGISKMITLSVKAPASTAVELKDAEGNPLAAVFVTLEDPRDGHVVASSSTDAQGTVELKAGMIGDDLQLAIHLPYPYEAPNPELIRLTKSLVITKVFILKYGTVSGTVKDVQGTIQPGITVQGISSGVKATTVTDRDGHYSLRLPGGFGQFSVSKPGQGTLFSSLTEESKKLVSPGQDTSLDVVTYPVGTGDIQLKLYRQTMDRVRQEIKLNNTALYSLKVTNAQGRALGSYIQVDGTLRVTGMYDRNLDVCLAELAGSLSACGKVTLDDRNTGNLELTLREEGAVVGKIQFADGSEIGRVQADLTAIDDSGRAVGSSWHYSVNSGSFRMGVEKAGSYELRFEADGTKPGVKERAAVSFRVKPGDTTVLDPIRLKNDGAFLNTATNRLEARHEVSRQGRIVLRGAYRNESSHPVNQARLMLSVPGGTSLVPDSVAINGTAIPAASIQEEGKVGYAIPLPSSLAPNEAGTVTYTLIVDEAAGDSVEPALRISYIHENVSTTEWIGSAKIAINDVILYAPQTVMKGEFAVEGLAPAGSVVIVKDGDVIAGQTEASSSGTWKANIQLGDQGEGLIHQLRAEASSAGGTRSSYPSWVTLDPSAPQPKELQVASLLHYQTVDTVKADLTGGIVPFPFTVNPVTPLYFSVSFLQPERVDQVNLHVGEEDVPLVFNPLLQKFEGMKLSSQVNMGSIWINYDTKPIPYADGQLTESELLQKLPASIRAYKGVVARSETSAAAVSTRQSLEEVTLTSEQTQGEEIHIGYFAEPVADFHPSPLPEGAPPVYDLQYQFNRGERTVTVSAIVPVQQAAAMLTKSDKGSGLVRVLANDPFAVVRIGADIKFELGKNTPGAGKPGDIFGVLKSGYDFKMRMDDMNAMLDQVMSSDCLPPHYSQYYADRLSDLSERLMENLTTRYTLQVSAMALAASGVGFLAGAATMGTSMAINARLDSLWTNQWNDLQKEFQTDQANADCKKKDKGRDSGDGGGSAGGGITGGRRVPSGGGGSSRKKVADPIWIYDPSGYVYEAVPSNRIGGVKATAFYRGAGGAWIPWDAGPFLQVNPVVTDSEGKYGWDVPEGTWQVLYEKNGYEPARSDALQVLPPHYDVNISMVSKQAPEVNALWQERDGSKLVLQFTKYMEPAAINTQTVTVSRAVYEKGGDPSFPVRIEPVDAEQDPQGHTWARTFNIVPSQPFTMNSEYRVQVEPYVQSYAGVPMSNGYDAKIVVTDRVPSFTDTAENVRAVAASDAVALLWSEDTNGQLDHYRLQWSKDENASTAEEMTIAAGIGSAVVTGLSSDQSYRLRLISVARDGGESPGVTVTIKTLQTKKWTADMTPPSVPANAAAIAKNDHITVKWTDPADSDFDRILLRVKAPGVVSYGSPIYIAKGQGTYESLPLTAYGTYQLQLSSTDIRDNESVPVTLLADYSGPGTANNGTSRGGSSGALYDNAADSGKDAETTELTVSEDRLIYEWDHGAVKLRLAGQAVPAGTKVKASAEAEGGNGMQLPTNFLLCSPAYTLEAGHPLSHPARLSIAYSADALQGADPRRLGIYKKDSSAPDMWLYVGGAVDITGGRITAEIGEWGTYAVMLYGHEFTDLLQHWSEEQIDILVSRHLLGGVNDSQFAPDALITRAQAARLIVSLLRASGRELHPSSNGGNSKFRDVRPEDWFASDVSILAAASVIEGDNGAFRPQDPITREELVVMLFRAMQTKPAENAVDLQSYSDAKLISEWAVQSMRSAIAAGWIQGTTTSQLEPRGLTTRAQAGVIMLRILLQAGVIDASEGSSNVMQ